MKRATAAASATWHCASLLLDYPDVALVDDLPAITRVVTRLPRQLADPIAEFLAHARASDLADLQSEYVATFDNRRRCSPYLTYFAHGDTRNRGLALLHFQTVYRAAGVHLDAAELPDHLSVVLEFAATVDPVAGRALLHDHRAGLETLRLALSEQCSPWRGVLAAVCGTLPPLVGAERDAIARLAAQGPPVEEVGMAPYGTPGFDPATGGRALVDLPMPTTVGARRRP